MSRQLAHRWWLGCQLAALYPEKDVLVLLSVRAWVKLSAMVRLEGLNWKLEKFDDLIGIQTHDIAPQPSTLPLAPLCYHMLWGHRYTNYIIWLIKSWHVLRIWDVAVVHVIEWDSLLVKSRYTVEKTSKGSRWCHMLETFSEGKEIMESKEYPLCIIYNLSLQHSVYCFITCTRVI
jgi:hypothetical protein